MTLDEQIKKLKTQGLIINDETEAIRILKFFGYYNVINSYRDPYIIKYPDGSKIYKPNNF